MKILALKTEIPTVPGWLLVGPPGGRVITQGGLNTTRNAKKNHQPFKPGKWFNWSIHIWSRQVLDLTLVPTLLRKENWIKDFPWSEGLKDKIYFNISGGEWLRLTVYDRSSIISIPMWDVFGPGSFAVKLIVQLSPTVTEGRGWVETTINNLSAKQNQADYHQ